MNQKYLELALSKVDDPRVLINGAALRVKELARGGRPLVPVLPGEMVNWLDVALREIAEGKIEIVARQSA